MAIHMAGSPEDYSATDPAQQQQDAEVCRAVDEQRRRADLALLRLIHALADAYNGGVYANSGVDVAANPSMISQRQAQAALSVARDFLRSDTPMTASQAHHSWCLCMAAQDRSDILPPDTFTAFEDLSPVAQLGELAGLERMRRVHRQWVLGNNSKCNYL